MKKLIFALLAVLAIVPVFGQKTFERVFIYPEGDSLVIHYTFNDDMEYLAVYEDDSKLGPNEIESIAGGVLYFNKKWTTVSLDKQGAWSKIPMPKPGVYDFTWEFITMSGHKAFSLVDQFSLFATKGNSRDKNFHFEVEITGDKTIVPRGTIRK